MTPRILFDPEGNITMFDGPGGFTQVILAERTARAIAQALGLEFVMCKPGTTLPA